MKGTNHMKHEAPVKHIAKRPSGPQHQLGRPTKQPKLIATAPARTGKTFISGEA